MDAVEPLRLVGPLVLALVSATALDQLMEARGLSPPGFRDPWRRVAGSLVVAFVLYVGVFNALAQVGLPPAPLPTEISPPRLFSLHALFVAGVLAWFLLGFAGSIPPGANLAQVLARQVGLVAPRPLREVGIGVGFGLLTWPVLLGVLIVVIGVLVAFGGENVIPHQPPELVVWIAALPLWLRVSVALSAGVVEEVFFRGFLQPRVGIGLSTLLFVLAHLSYDQPFMLVGITVLSLFFAGLVWWRQNLWPAIAAHALFDGVQLLFLIPWALRQWPKLSHAPIALSGWPW